MLAEAGHSLADTLKEFFLWISLKRSKRDPDRQHRFGYGKERFFWALIAAGGIFIAGAGSSLFEAFKAFSECPKSADNGYLIDYVVFGFAAVIEFVSSGRGGHAHHHVDADLRSLRLGT
jgi:divalent metal cation (Fe/Co/Zn/Cd) transporter